MGEPQAKRSHQARALGTAASNVMQQINAGNRQDIVDSFDAIHAMDAGDMVRARGLLMQIGERNLLLREAGIFAVAGMYVQADDALMTWAADERKRAKGGA